ncbi:MAG: F0F1 ATP synthase subunit B [Bacteroidales bacterium]|nr:F0F1 ATP synthase subunit B [Bacteroidales bacterium]
MDLLIPEIGIIFWMIISFSIAFFILAKYAWKPIVNALKERDTSIAEAIKDAEKARLEVSRLQTESEKILSQAKDESDKIIQEARDFKESVLSEANELAKKQTHKMIEEARKAIINERTAALYEIKKQVSELSVAISEKILMQELKDPDKQQKLIEKSLSEMKFN